jgi:hypothetical protein
VATSDGGRIELGQLGRRSAVQSGNIRTDPGTLDASCRGAIAPGRVLILPEGGANQFPSRPALLQSTLTLTCSSWEKSGLIATNALPQTKSPKPKTMRMTVNMRRLVARPFKTGWCPGGQPASKQATANRIQAGSETSDPAAAVLASVAGHSPQARQELGETHNSSPKLSSVTVCFGRLLRPTLFFAAVVIIELIRQSYVKSHQPGTNTNEKMQPAPLQDRERRQASAPHLQQVGLSIVALALAGRLSF